MKTESTNDPLQPGRMSTKLIQNLIDNYRQNHLSAINGALGIEDAHSIWFDLPKLKKFIAMIESEAAKTNPDITEEDLGIRFYYAAYPNGKNWDIMETHPVPEEYAERHTLVLIPTVKKSNEAGESDHYDFNFSGDRDSVALALNARGIKMDEDTIGENNGQIIPPYNSRGELF
ncbi:hypothetical protein C1637_24585 [Chryseobacterium lactis]|uniref:Uncharacterized protein n=1 Tax=Chryseobacterium lactis TaxID=1241981 RepID=A0A3G6RVB3_CHRLC|nr:hypothetical protein [Chryseobacterium lactis]AZA81979.1 hypothetical protein EG342_08685 [Chryseobacterium lactis]AZB06977.1 hypothetical protein EG341_24800 [Chryseobacterium lactis]PNW11076.1 hypothetical protein C1637_24585 [Chryseobacterium lactis]